MFRVRGFSVVKVKMSASLEICYAFMEEWRLFEKCGKPQALAILRVGLFIVSILLIVVNKQLIFLSLSDCAFIAAVVFV